MESFKTTLNTSFLSLTSHCFEILHEKVMEHLEKESPNISKQGVSQLYGFGSFQESQPSLKMALEKLSGSFINGKYLYDKKREFQSGQPIIRLNKPYKYILFEYLGCEDVKSFLDKYVTDIDEREKQIQLISNRQKSSIYYYVSYHFGEYKEIVKSQFIVKDNWKSVEYRYLYPDGKGDFEEFIYYGTIKQRADTLHIRTRTLMDGKMVDSGENILYIGYGDPSKSKFILGVFSAFDINNRLIAVKSIHEKCESKEEMELISKTKKVPGYIAQELRNKRIENDIHIPNDKLEISHLSPHYITYEKIAGKYRFSFSDLKSELSDLHISIHPDTYKITSLVEGVMINSDHFELIQNGSVLHFSFKMTGLASFIQLDIYVKTYYLHKEMDEVKGVFSGVDLENRLVSGEVMIVYHPNSH